MPKSRLTAEERKQYDAFRETLEAALSQVDSKDRLRVELEVEKAYPVSQEIRDAHASEVLDQMADLLRDMEQELNCGKFEPDAPWGLAVYRTAYSDDEAWKRMLHELEDSLEGLPYQPAPNCDLHPRHRFKIMDDQSQFEGATIDSLRKNFSAWVMDEYRNNCKDDQRPSIKELAADMEDDIDGGPRYNFFLVVDDICLESLDQPCGAVAKFVQRSFESGGDNDFSAEEIEELGPREADSEWEDGITECEFENVGWMYMEAPDYVAFQHRLVLPSNWEDVYLRPPQLNGYAGFECTPGSWRK